VITSKGPPLRSTYMGFPPLDELRPVLSVNHELHVAENPNCAYEFSPESILGKEVPVPDVYCRT